MKIKQKFRKVMATLLSVAMVMTLCVGLDFGAITASAEGKTYTVTVVDDGTKITLSGDTSIECFTPEDTLTITMDKASSVSTHQIFYYATYENDSDKSINGSSQLGDVSINNGNDSVFFDELKGKNVSLNITIMDNIASGSNYGSNYSQSVRVNATEIVTAEPITINFVSAGGTTGTMEPVTLPAGTTTYTLPTPEFTPEANREFYLWDVADENREHKVGISGSAMTLTGNSNTYTATAYYGYTATITGVIDDDDVTFISERMIPGKQLLSPEFSNSPNPILAEGNGIIINTTLSPAPQITATNATITLHSSDEDDGTYTYYYAATNITGPVTVTAEADESEEVPTYTITLDASKFTGSYIIGYGDDIEGNQQQLRHGGTIEIPIDGTVTISAPEAFTAVADGATVGELTEGEGLDRIISNFTKDTTIVINDASGEEETTYNVTLDSSKYEGTVILITYDNGNKYREETSTNSNSLEVPESGFARVFGYGGEFTVTAEGATVGELIDAGDEGSYREITNFTKDTTVVVNAVTGDSGNTGDITNDTKPEDNACNADIEIDVEDIITDIGLTDEEILKIENGEDISVYLEVKNADATVSTEDKTATENALAANMKVGMYLDIDLLKKIGNNNPTAITETKQPITITFVVPDKLINTDTSKTRTYKIIRVHNGTAKVLDCSFNPATKTASFATDKFSSYAIAYVDTIDGGNNSGSTGGNSGGNTTPTTRPNYPTVVIKPTTPEKDDDKDNDYEGEDVSSAASVELDETMLEIGSASESDVTVYITFTMFTLSVAYAIFKKKKHE